ncbi:MAG TPA: hypothetical protein VGF06_14835 [Terriglobales bacterium]
MAYPAEAEVRGTVPASGDSLERAQKFFEQGYHQDAAILAGDVLEGTLLKLCERNSVPLPKKPRVVEMNEELAKKGAYDGRVGERLARIADTWDKAVRGEWSDLSACDVEVMLLEMRDFLDEHSA